MTRAYFVSDLHLHSADDPNAKRFETFLSGLGAADGTTHLFLLGDVFDMWLANHRYFVDRYERVIAQLVRLHAEGVTIHYFEGNHDLHLKKYWSDDLGFVVHSGPVSLRLAGLTLRLEHGDQMDPEDRGYRFLRWFLRTPPLKLLIHHLPGSLAAWIGERASASSRHYTSERKTITAGLAIEKIRRHARQAHAADPFDLLIAGHVHFRDDYRDDAGFRAVNLGTWLDTPCYFVLENGTGRFVEVGEPDEDNVAQ